MCLQHRHVNDTKIPVDVTIAIFMFVFFLSMQCNSCYMSTKEKFVLYHAVYLNNSIEVKNKGVQNPPSNKNRYIGNH